ncbi:MAG: heparinase [Gemmatimonadetes bacterium]|mgnify:CR=1 FL=1|nr:heparinase [Gemmatimonadota bacterium]MBT6146967.1 heparinase [Gemmatimonadota bacterium]MBT7860975.1 heparinase [Gemmatimonadota bacterium]
MFAQRFDRETLSRHLPAIKSWRPYPTIDTPDAWAELPKALRQEAIDRADAALSFAWTPLPATLFLEYVRSGNRDRYQNKRNRRRHALGDLVIGECLRNDGHYLDAIVDGLWATCEESFWGVPAHIGGQAQGPGLPDVEEPIVDLFAAETAAALAWCLYLLSDRLDSVAPMVARRVTSELQRRMLTPCLERDDFFWMGLSNTGRRVNNWNPWICSNWIATVLLVEVDATRRVDAIHKILRCLDCFVDPYPIDGGCDEGPSYWGRAGASLFDCLELLHKASDGAIDLYDEPLIADIGRFIYRVHIGGDDYINFADAPAIVTPDAALVHAYGHAIDDEPMQQHGAALATRYAGRSSANVDLGRRLRQLTSAKDLAAKTGASPLPRDVWLDQIQVMVARDEGGSTAGFFVGAKGGHNDESHNHNDVGHYVLYLDGQPVVVDAGVETYTAKTFSSDRYDIWTMQSAYHNLPTIGDVQQAPGEAYAASDVEYHANDQQVTMSLDLAATYPDNCVHRWTRRIQLQRRSHLRVEDDFELAVPTTGLTLSLLVAAEPVIEGVGIVALPSRPLGAGRATGAARLAWQIPDAQLHVDQIDLDDTRLRTIWGNTLYRLRWVLTRTIEAGQWSLQFTKDAS